jgi:hypothetical protein
MRMKTPMNKRPLIAKTNHGQPPRGAFDYLLKDKEDKAPRGWTPRPPPEHGGRRPRRARAEITGKHGTAGSWQAGFTECD